MHKTAATLALLSSIGCANITAPSTDRMRVVASPRAAQVSLDGEVVGAAPTHVEVPRRGSSSVEVSAPGYATSSCSTRMSPSGGYIAADIALCVLLFPIGCISFIDANGAWNALASPVCNVKLQPERGPSS